MSPIRFTRLPFCAVALAATLAGCDALTEPESPPSAPAAFLGADGLVPISLRETAVPAPDAIMVPCDPAVAGVALPNRMIATGDATHLGHVRSIITHTWCGVDLATGVLSSAGTAEHTAPNEDRLEATWTGTISGSLLTLDITFVGGTGRFEDAAGWIVASGRVDLASGAASWAGTGRITRPGY